MHTPRVSPGGWGAVSAVRLSQIFQGGYASTCPSGVNR